MNGRASFVELRPCVVRRPIAFVPLVRSIVVSGLRTWKTAPKVKANFMDKNNESPTEHLEHTGRGALASLREAGEDIQNRLGQFWESSKEQAASCARVTDRAIRDNPWPSIGIAFGVGLVLGLLVSSGGRGSDED